MLEESETSSSDDLRPLMQRALDLRRVIKAVSPVQAVAAPTRVKGQPKRQLSARRAERLIEAQAEIQGKPASIMDKNVEFIPRLFANVTLPYRELSTHQFERRNGAITLSMLAPPSIGLPYGVKPRLLIAWMASEALRTKSRHLSAGTSLAAFMRRLGYQPTGGKTGTIGGFKEQLTRLCACHVSVIDTRPDARMIKNTGFVRRANLLWSPVDGHFATELTFELTEEFFAEVSDRAVPIDLRVLQELKGSALSLDIYFWLTLKAFTSKPTNRPIPWRSLADQFGASYGGPAATRAFKRNFLEHLRTVLVLFPEAHVQDTELGLIVKPSRTSVPRYRGAALL